MTGLVDQYGKPLSSQHKKASPPKLGEAFGNWAGRDLTYLELPGGGTIGFDLKRLTLTDYRKMTTHYQINSSLSVLGFLLHQADWHIECKDKKIADFITDNLGKIWTNLSRALNTAHWAGFAPSVLQWENDLQGSSVQLTKIKDLIPEETWVHWKLVDGYAPPNAHVKPKLKVYDGIRQYGAPWPIPNEASLWYPMLMTHGDYYGTKLLKSAFTSWYFSLLMHLFANRYYERFGEPTPIGRAPMDDDIEMPDGSLMNSRDYMLQMIQNVRSRAVIVLPNDRNPGDEGMRGSGKAYDYELEYLESQMRGADFERYIQRLDEEMSLGLFTPILLMRTADVGSYNLGQGQMQMYLWMLNALNGDRKTYIDNYVLSRMVDYNFSPNAPRAFIKFRKMGNDNSAMLATVVQALLSGNKAEVDLEQLGGLVGLNLKQVQQLKVNPAPTDNPGADPVNDPKGNPDPASGDNPATVGDNVKNRVAAQVGAAFAKGEFDADLKIDMGYRKKMRSALQRAGVDPLRTEGFFRFMDAYLEDLVCVPFSGAGECAEMFGKMLDYQLEGLLSA